MNARHVDLDRDAHYAQVRQPRPMVDQGISRSQLEIMLANGEKLLDIARRCASCNDVASLKVFLEPENSDLAEELKRQQDDQSNPKISVTYAVAHMMVDGGGNEDFAMSWMTAFGHNKNEAASHFLALWYMPNEGLEFEQKRLAMAQLGQVTELRQFTDQSAICQTNSAGVHSDRLVREIGFYLRATHPDGVPQVASLNYDAQVITQSMGENWGDFPNLYAAILQTYPPEHARANEQMQEATRKVLQGAPIARLSPTVFEALERWGSPSYGADVWTWSKSGHKSCMESILAGASSTVVLDLKRLIDAGADVNATFRARVGTLHRAIDVAAENGNSAIVGFLLANGADPELKAIDRDEKFCRSAADWIRGLSEDEIAQKDHDAEMNSSSTTPNKADFKGVRALIDVYLARRHALDAIEECMSTPPAPGR